MGLTLPAEFGYVLFTGIAAFLMALWQGIQVGESRDKFGVPYPEMYSKDNKVFNCMQRAHQNTLENLPQFFFLLLVGGWTHPTLAAAAGACWIVARIMYNMGYSTGNPDGRLTGAYCAFACTLTLLGTACHTAYLAL